MRRRLSLAASQISLERTPEAAGTRPASRQPGSQLYQGNPHPGDNHHEEYRQKEAQVNDGALHRLVWVGI